MCNADVPRIGPRMILVQRHWVAGWRLRLVWFTGSYAFPTTEREEGDAVLLRENMREAPHNQAELVNRLGRWVPRDGNLDVLAAATWELELDIVVFGPIRAKD